MSYQQNVMANVFISMEIYLFNFLNNMVEAIILYILQLMSRTLIQLYYA
jgi:hypothetical protein